jgi:1-carboxybiuret hydrolase
VSLSAIEIAAQVKRGERSAAEVLEETLARVTALDPKLNCFTARTFERARAEALAVDQARGRGETVPPLAGVPYAVKNLFDVRGVPTLCGGHVNEVNEPARADSYLVGRMQAAGGLLIGTLNMDEHAYGFTCENTYYGATRNPHDTTRVSGGSSGGSAAAVGGGLVPLALGSDTSGSIRVPASLCGIFGLKPTYGRLSRGGSFPFVDSLDHVGPFARSAADLALSYDLLQGKDSGDPVCAQRELEPVSAALSLPPGLRIGVLRGWFWDWAGESARRAVQIAAQALGASQDCELKGAEAARTAAFVITSAEGGALHRQKLIKRYAEFEPASRDRLVAGSLVPAAWVVRAQYVRRQVYAEALRLFEKFDLLLAAAAPVTAPLIGSETIDINGRSMPTRASLGVLSQPISCIGLPACAAPIWPGIDHLPMGVQLIGAPWREDICLAAAAALEQKGVAAVRPATLG